LCGKLLWWILKQPDEIIPNLFLAKASSFATLFDKGSESEIIHQLLHLGLLGLLQQSD
jgi:hypothetical protein